MAGTISVETMSGNTYDFTAIDWNEHLAGAFLLNTDKGEILIPWHRIASVDLSKAEVQI